MQKREYPPSPGEHGDLLPPRRNPPTAVGAVTHQGQRSRGDMTNEDILTQAWLLVGVTRDLPGVLQMAGGRFTFTSHDDQVIFDAPLSGVSDVKFPWYYFGGGMKFSLGGERYRVSFVRPTAAGGGIADIPAGRRAGKLWKSALSSRV